MIDIIIRYCGCGQWLPIIIVTGTDRELYRGERVRSFEAAALRAKTAWDEGLSGNIVEFKQEHGL